MSTNLPNRAQIEAAQPLDFPPAPPREQRTTLPQLPAPAAVKDTAAYTAQPGEKTEN